MKKYVSFAFIFSFIPVNLYAESTVELPSMLITGEFSNSTSNISHYDAEDLKRMELSDLNGILRQESSVTVSQGSSQMTSNLSLRGAGGQGMMTIDGVPIFSAFVGVYSLQRHALDSFDSLTVTRGFSGEQQASRTLGGSIHLKTRKAITPFLHLEGGSYDSLRESMGGGLQSEWGNFSGVVGRSDIFSGISEANTGVERDKFGATHASGNWEKVLENGKLSGSLYFVRSDQAIDNAGLLPDGKNFGWIDDKNAYLSDETWVTQFQVQHNLLKNWNSSLQMGFTQDQQKLTRRIKPFSITNQLFLLDWVNTHHTSLSGKDEIIWHWGINTQHQQSSVLPSAQTNITPNLNMQTMLGEWQLTANTRLDHNDVYGNHQTFSLGINSNLFKNLNLWANGGTGYRQPGVSELTHPTLGNSTLQGEHNTGGELGLTFQLAEKSEIKLDGYYQNYRQMILMAFDPRTGSVKAGNLSEVDMLGADLKIKHFWTDFWQTELHYGYQYAKNPNTNLRVPMLPDHQVTFWNEFSLLQPLKLNVELTYHNGYFFDGGNKVPAENAARVNAILKYSLTPKTEFYLRGENLSNNHTMEINNFSFNGIAVYGGFRIGY